MFVDNELVTTVSVVLRERSVSRLPSIVPTRDLTEYEWSTWLRRKVHAFPSTARVEDH
jgi:hypothetical protein